MIRGQVGAWIVENFAKKQEWVKGQSGNIIHVLQYHLLMDLKYEALLI